MLARLTSPGIYRAVLAMIVVVTASNILVQYPVDFDLGPVHLGDILTWGAFTYPFAFLVSDLTNRHHGPQLARRVVMAGFAVAVVISVYLATPRIAIASGTAFLTAQLLDVTVFNWLRRQSWWRAPIFGTLAGSVVDTLIFFSIAFSAAFAFVGPEDGFALEAAPLLGLFAVETPRWLSWALGDLTVKLLIAVFALIPYRLIAARWTQPVAEVA